MPIKSSQTTHFGFENVPTETKEPKVRAVFDSVANQYDLMNDLMSFGIHRLWKRFVLAKSLIKPGDVVLDVAGGSGDIASMLAKRVGEKGRVVLSDINDNMLAVGRDKLIDEGYIAQTDFVQANAEQLPFEKNTFDAVTIAFGLRNVTDKAKALASMYRVCKPGGKVMILEFSTPNSSILKSIYDAYSFHILPKLGGWVAEDEGSYQYLVESIRMHPDQNTLKSMIEAAQFEDCVYHNLSGGIVALHVAYKY